MSHSENIIAVKFFFFASRAEFYAARLKADDIPCFISNVHTTTMLPQGDASIGLHVRNEDLEVALAIVKELDKRNNEKPDISFRDADKEDIYYEKEVNEKENQLLNTDFIFTWTSILLFILILGILAAGISGWSIF